MIYLDNGKITFDTEILAIDVFKKLHDKDDKLFLKFLSYLFYAHNLKSIYLISYAEEDLYSIVKRDVFNDENYSFTNEMLKAEQIYSDLKFNFPAKIIKSGMNTLNKIKKELDSLNYDEITDLNKRIDLMSDSLGIINKLSTASIKLNQDIQTIIKEEIVNNKTKKKLGTFEKPRKDR